MKCSGAAREADGTGRGSTRIKLSLRVLIGICVPPCLPPGAFLRLIVECSSPWPFPGVSRKK